MRLRGGLALLAVPLLAGATAALAAEYQMVLFDPVFGRSRAVYTGRTADASAPCDVKVPVQAPGLAGCGRVIATWDEGHLIAGSGATRTFTITACGLPALDTAAVRVRLRPVVRGAFSSAEADTPPSHGTLVSAPAAFEGGRLVVTIRAADRPSEDVLAVEPAGSDPIFVRVGYER